jgi:putative oxidoreductase
MFMTWLDFIGIPLLARLCLVILFPFSTLDKIFNYKNAVAQANNCILPGGPLLLIIGGLVEVFGSLCVVCAWHDRLAAFTLAGYCAVTAILFHNFWSYPDFWSASADSKARTHFWDFLKNFSLAGGLILLVLMSHMIPASDFIAHPLSSTPVTALP